VTNAVESPVEELKKRHDIVGRNRELHAALIAAGAGKHILLEGPVGVGKTTIALAVSSHLQRDFIRIDGDERYTEQKLAGWYDPPLVLAKGYTGESFIHGPLSQSMTGGSILLINELNRMPEGTQNVMLTAMDEHAILIPKYGPVRAEVGFMIIATQNPDEYIGTSQLSEALRDRFVCIDLDYQSEEEERRIVELRSRCESEDIIDVSVNFCRQTRHEEEIRRGSSIRGAIDLADIFFTAHGRFSDDLEPWIEAAELAFLTKVELHDFSKQKFHELMKRIAIHALSLHGQRRAGGPSGTAASQGRPAPDAEALERFKKKSSD
jgi:MoxR-like ATPase